LDQKIDQAGYTGDKMAEELNFDELLSNIGVQPDTPDELQPTAPLPREPDDQLAKEAVGDSNLYLLPQHQQALAFVGLYNAAIRIIDAQKVISGKYGNKTINLADLPGGEYLKDLVGKDNLTFADIANIVSTSNSVKFIKNTRDIDDAVDMIADNPLMPGATICEDELKLEKQRLHNLKISLENLSKK